MRYYATGDNQYLQRPQINLARSTTERMWLVNLCAFLAVFQSSLTDSYSSLLVAFGAVSGAVITELLVFSKSGKTKSIKDGSAIASALILSLLLPNRISPVYAAAGAVFATAVIKHSFGGLGSNWLNPAAGGWLFIRFTWPAAFRAALEGSPLSVLAESVSRGAVNPAGSPLGILKVDAADLFAVATPFDEAVRSVLNHTIFSLSGAEIQGGYIDLFASPFPGIIADRAVFALLLGTIIISASQVSRSWIPAVYLAVFGILTRIAGAFAYGGYLGGGDVLFALCSGGTLTAAFFLAADPATGAKSKRGALLAALAGGAAAFFFRFYGAEPYGAVFAALVINAALLLIQIVENRKLYQKQGKYA